MQYSDETKVSDMQTVKMGNLLRQGISITKEGVCVYWLRLLTLVYWQQGFDSAVMECVWLDGAALQVDKPDLHLHQDDMNCIYTKTT